MEIGTNLRCIHISGRVRGFRRVLLSERGGLRRVWGFGSLCRGFRGQGWGFRGRGLRGRGRRRPVGGLGLKRVGGGVWRGVLAVVVAVRVRGVGDSHLPPRGTHYVSTATHLYTSNVTCIIFKLLYCVTLLI